MPQWIIVAALLSILATVWLAWLLWRVNVGPQAKRSGDGGPQVLADTGGKSRHDNDASDGGADGADGGGGD